MRVSKWASEGVSEGHGEERKSGRMEGKEGRGGWVVREEGFTNHLTI